jgi:hypothetical protein
VAIVRSSAGETRSSGGWQQHQQVGNRPGWGGGWGYGRPGWGYGGGHGHWGNHWNSRHIHNHHHGCYHGCWSGNWGSSWYVPLVYGATAWGVSAALPSWGYDYGYSYSNPYYVESAVPMYDYSQPIVINTYNTPTSDASAEASPEQTATQDTTQTTQGYQLFDQAREAFKQGNYDQALALDEQAIQSVPDDPVLHEFGALCLFAQGNYDRAAAVLNALLAVAPGMDWATMSSLYPNVAPYAQSNYEHWRLTSNKIPMTRPLASCSPIITWSPGIRRMR